MSSCFNCLRQYSTVGRRSIAYIGFALLSNAPPVQSCCFSANAVVSVACVGKISFAKLSVLVIINEKQFVTLKYKFCMTLVACIFTF